MFCLSLVCKKIAPLLKNATKNIVVFLQGRKLILFAEETHSFYLQSLFEVYNSICKIEGLTVVCKK
jgi:hypothetical protein